MAPGPLAGMLILPLGVNLILAVLMALYFGRHKGPSILIPLGAFVMFGIAPLVFLVGHNVRQYRGHQRFLRGAMKTDKPEGSERNNG